MSETYVERIHDEPVVLDIGGAIGALIIYTDGDWVGREIELSPAGSAGHHRTHNQVHERRFNASSVFAAVYPDLHEGRYVIWGDSSRPVDSVTIRGGEVSELDWRSASRR